MAEPGRVDWIVLTHAHPEHAGDAGEIEARALHRPVERIVSLDPAEIYVTHFSCSIATPAMRC